MSKNRCFKEGKTIEIHDSQRLKELQALPLERKVGITIARIIEYYQHYEGKVYVSFSGGKDSTVLLYIARQIFPDIEAVFCDTGTELPAIREFVKTIDNVTTVRPEKKFVDVIHEHGYPVVSKKIAQYVEGAKRGANWALKIINGLNLDGTENEYRQSYKKYAYLVNSDFNISDKCCNELKKKPFAKYGKISKKKGILGTMTEESDLRKKGWIVAGCNNFKIGKSMPMSFWKEKDVIEYIQIKKIPYASVYGDIVNGKFTGVNRTGCFPCLFGANIKNKDIKNSKLVSLKDNYPKMYDWCMGGGEFNEQGLWVPNKEGLGYKYIIDRWLPSIKY